MAQQVIDHGTTPGDGTGETLFGAWTKANANFTELYLWNYSRAAEHTPAGVLVYPSNEAQTIAYNADFTVDYFTCTYNTYTWTLAFTYTDGNVTQMDADDGAGGNSWSRTITYTDGQVTNEGVWA